MLSSDTAKCIIFWVHKLIAKKVLSMLRNLGEAQFEEVAWEIHGQWGFEGCHNEVPNMDKQTGDKHNRYLS